MLAVVSVKSRVCAYETCRRRHLKDSNIVQISLRRAALPHNPLLRLPAASHKILLSLACNHAKL